MLLIVGRLAEKLAREQLQCDRVHVCYDESVYPVVVDEPKEGIRLHSSHSLPEAFAFVCIFIYIPGPILAIPSSVLYRGNNLISQYNVILYSDIPIQKE